MTPPVKSAKKTALRGNVWRLQAAGRICCALFGILETKLREIYDGKKPEARGNFLLIATCEGSIAALVQQAGQWTDFRCRTGVGIDNVEAMVQIIAPQVQKLQAGTPVFFVHDGNNPRFASEMMGHLESISAQDVTTAGSAVAHPRRIIGQSTFPPPPHSPLPTMSAPSLPTRLPRRPRLATVPGVCRAPSCWCPCCFT